MKRKLLSILLCTAMTTAMLAGCGSGERGNGSSGG